MYFDYAATTPPAEEVLETFDRVNRSFWANPHSLHPPGLQAEALLEKSRAQVLDLLGASNDFRCTFTSGTTESNNLALKGAVRHARNRGRHIITSEGEHPSVLEVCRFLEQEGCELTLLPVRETGAVNPEQLRAALRQDTVLVSLMQTNNETGAVNDILRLGEIIKAESKALFHVDAAQSVGKVPLQLDGSPIDLLAFSAHKFFGLKGSGALLSRRRLPLPALLQGGGQEEGLRSGTADPARAAAMARALRLAIEELSEALERVAGFKSQILDAITSVEGAELNGSAEKDSPYIINLSIAGIRPETLLQALAEQEIYISTVSACSSGSAEESHVVRALTGSVERARTSIRISLSSITTKAEVDTLCRTIVPTIESVRLTKGRGR